MRKILVRAEAFCNIASKIYIFDYGYNSLIEYDVEEEKSIEICRISEKNMKYNRMYGDIVEKDGYLYMIPLLSDSIVKVNIQKRIYYRTPIDLTLARNNGNKYNSSNFFSCIVYGDLLFVFPTTFPAIIEYNTLTDSVKYHTDWVESVLELMDKNESSFFRRVLRIDDYVYAPLCGADAVFKYCLITGDYCILNVNGGEKGYSDICYDGKNFWLSVRKGDRVVKWNERAGISKCITGFYRKNTPFASIEYFNNKVWVFPRNNGSIGLVDMKTDRIIEYGNYKEQDGYSSKVIGEYMYVSLTANGGVLKISNNDNAKLMDVCFPDDVEEDYKAHCNICNNRRGIIREEKGISYSSMLKALK